MNLEAVLSVLLIFGSVCYLSLGVRLAGYRRASGGLQIGALFVLISIWVIGSAIELLSSTYAVFSIGRTAHFIGAALVPVVAFVSFREYTNAETPMRNLILLLIIPLLSIILAATNINHEFMWYLPIANEAGVFLTRPERWGPWFLFVHLPYSYTVIFAGIIALATRSSAVAPAQRRGMIFIIAACFVPLIAAVAYDLGYGPNTISYVPLAFVAMLPVYLWLVLGQQILEFTPLAYETVFQNMQDPVVVIDEQCRVIGLNHTAEDLLSIEESAALLEPLENIFGEDSPEVFEALDSGLPQKLWTATGRFLHLQVSPISTKSQSGRAGRVLMFRDVSDVEKAQSDVRKSEKLLSTLINHSVNGIVRLRWVDGEGGGKTLRSIFANSAAARFLGTEAETLIDCLGSDIVKRAALGMDETSTREIIARFEHAAGEGRGLDVELRQNTKGPPRWLRMMCEPVSDDFAVTFVDITDSKAKEQQMESIAISDPLTGVLNRRGFEKDAAARLSVSADDATGALLFIDINDFKSINDAFGHEVGDHLLMIAAKRIENSLRSCDIIGRHGGDEFVALVPDVDSHIAGILAERLANELDQSYSIGSQELRCAASIGMALYPVNANTLTGLLRVADQAMYRAKARCRGVANIDGSDLLEKAV